MILNNLIERLSAAGKKVYFVGGCVRDKVAGFPVSDIDLATNATPDEILNIFKDRETSHVGISFGVVIVDGIEVATFRKDIHGAKWQVEFAKTIEDDLARRDLTINALAEDAITGEVIDLFGGIEDIHNRTVKFVGNPYDRINEDPCRILRACRFLAKLQGSFEKRSLTALRKSSHLIRKVHPDRIHKEIVKVLEYKCPSLFFSALYVISGLKYVFPSMNKCFNHEHGTHHIENIGEHLMLTGDIISSKYPLLRLAGYLHDIGKPTAYKKDNYSGSFTAHEHIGTSIVEKELKRLNFSNDEITKIKGLVLMHMRPCRTLKPASARRLRKKLHENKVDPRDYLRLKLADRLANVKHSKNKASMIKPMLTNVGIISTEDKVISVKDLALSGGKIIELFGLEPGPIVGSIQRYLLRFVIDRGPEYNNKNILKKIVKLYLMENTHA